MKLGSFAVLSLLFAQIAGAQTYFTTTGFGDLLAGFRKTGTNIEANQLVVNLGNITNLLALSAGTTINMSNYSIVQMTNMCPDNLANLQWSVFAGFQRLNGIREPYWNTPVGMIPPATTWLTVARPAFNTQSTPPTRLSYNAMAGGIRNNAVIGMDTGTTQVSTDLVTTNQFNNTLLVTEPVAYDSQQNTYSYFVSDASPPDTNSNFRGYCTFNIENFTPSPFNSPQRSDLYEMAPFNYLDPFSGTTNGPAYYVGYFTLNNADGTMTFTRASAVTPPQPQPPVLSISTSLSSSGGPNPQVNSVISFNTTNAATYTLYYTNTSGLRTPVTNWPTIGTTITGDGSVHSFTNSSTDPSRFYSVGAQ